jgi:hypothetical protein
MEAMRAHFEREAAYDSPWTSYNASLGRPLLNTEKFLSPKKAAPDEPTVSSPSEQAAEEPSDPASTLPVLNTQQ